MLIVGLNVNVLHKKCQWRRSFNIQFRVYPNAPRRVNEMTQLPSRSRWDTGEGTCSYLLPLSHRDVGNIFATSATLVNTGSTNGLFSMPNAVVGTIFQSIFYEYLLDINIPQGDLGKMIFKTILTRCKLCMSAKLNLRKFPLREVCTWNENHNGLGLGLILIP